MISSQQESEATHNPKETNLGGPRVFVSFQKQATYPHVLDSRRCPRSSALRAAEHHEFQLSKGEILKLDSKCTTVPAVSTHQARRSQRRGQHRAPHLSVRDEVEAVAGALQRCTLW